MEIPLVNLFLASKGAFLQEELIFLIFLDFEFILHKVSGD